MPKTLLDFMGYSFFFWSNEAREEPHIHVCKGRPSANSAKFWIRDDEVVLEHNKAGIPANDLKKYRNILVSIRKTSYTNGIGILINRKIDRVSGAFKLRFCHREPSSTKTSGLFYFCLEAEHMSIPM